MTHNPSLGSNPVIDSIVDELRDMGATNRASAQRMLPILEMALGSLTGRERDAVLTRMDALATDQTGAGEHGTADDISADALDRLRPDLAQILTDPDLLEAVMVRIADASRDTARVAWAAGHAAAEAVARGVVPEKMR